MDLKFEDSKCLAFRRLPCYSAGTVLFISLVRQWQGIPFFEEGFTFLTEEGSGKGIDGFIGQEKFSKLVPAGHL